MLSVRFYKKKYDQLLDWKKNRKTKQQQINKQTNKQQ